MRPTGRAGAVAIGAGRGPDTDGAAGAADGLGAEFIMGVSFVAGRNGGTPMSGSRAAEAGGGAAAGAPPAGADLAEAGSAGEPSSFLRLKMPMAI
ncbi:hypothetical protein GCM10009416_31790 [Craurococcus roseus]|uniref:Uncharacterized protein n=1 Tax=Craurococcus roseus TaxID=77585 RepID=A0ABN1FHQ1_9PROT